MRRAFETETVIDRPVGEVWRELTDWDNAPRWMAGIERMSSDAGAALGATITFRTRGRTRTSTISAVEPERSITLDSVQGPVTARYRYHLEPHGAQTTARLTADVAAAGLMALLGPVIRAAIRRTDAGQLDVLRTLLESRRT
jgi:carbon monoxide dehydrogenase subunit G